MRFALWAFFPKELECLIDGSGLHWRCERILNVWTPSYRNFSLAEGNKHAANGLEPNLRSLKILLTTKSGSHFTLRSRKLSVTLSVREVGLRGKPVQTQWNPSEFGGKPCCNFSEGWWSQSLIYVMISVLYTVSMELRVIQLHCLSPSWISGDQLKIRRDQWLLLTLGECDFLHPVVGGVTHEPIRGLGFQ